MFPNLSLVAVAAPVLLATTLGWTAFAHDASAPRADAPLACAFEVTPVGRLFQIDANVISASPLSGIYQLDVSRPGGRLSQSGPFDVRSGEKISLGQITVNGPAQAIETTFTLTIDGQEIICPDQT